MSHFSRVTRRCCPLLLSSLVIAAVAIGAAHGANTKGNSMSYGEAREFLAKHTSLIELTNDAGARVAIAPAWQGRVMTSTCGGLEGPSFGFVNREFIEAGRSDPHFNNSAPKTHVALPRGRAVQPLVQARRKASDAELVHAGGAE